MIIIPRMKIIEPKSELVSPCRMSGEFELIATNVYTGKQRQLAKFPNLILDLGLDRIGINENWMANCYVGSGNSQPVVTQSALDVLVGSTTNRISNVTTILASSPYYTQQAITYRFAQGAAAGNLSEIGVGWASTSLFSRALILDSFGDPTTITVLADEFLDAVYRLRNYPPLTDDTYEVVIDGVTTTIVSRAARVTQAGSWLSTTVSGPRGGGQTSVTGGGGEHTCYNGGLGPITGNPSGTSAGNPGASNQAYSNGSYYRDYTVTWGLTIGNLAGGVSAFRTNFGSQFSNARFGSMQFSFSPAIQKNDTKTMVLAFRNSWGRYTV
jgi:hypothetical protein